MKKAVVCFVLILFPVALLTIDTDVHSADETIYAATELLCRPTDTSITINALADRDLYIYIKYGTASGALSQQTTPKYYPGNSPINIQLTGLQPDMRYYYRMVYSESNSGPWIERDEHTFHTQRSVGSSFVFTITSDSHLSNLGTSSLFQQTVNNILADRPDFHIDLGDTFGMDNITTEAQARQLYLSLRPYFGTFAHSAPLFLVLGNHENEEGWNLDDNPSSPLLSVNARKLYYPNPVPDGFYSGNTEQLATINEDHFREDYYAWQWGDALFVVIDPYWYTMKKPYSGSIGGEKNDEIEIGDRWDWTLGYQQYQWFKRTLENSAATYKFVFAHHITGGSHDYARGGAEAAPYFEWGGRNWDGTWAFDTRRPGWTLPIHDLMVANGVKAFFHGHDHEYAKEERDGIIYQLVPMAADASYGYGFNLYKESDPYTDVVLPNSGHLRITVSPSQATVDYVRSFTSGSNNGQVAYSYNIGGNSSGLLPGAPSNLTAVAVSSTQINLSWQDNSNNESGFRIERKTEAGGTYSQVGSAAANAAAYTDSGLSAGATYYYRVQAYNANGPSAYSGEASAMTPSSTALPAAPSNLEATAVSSTQIKVTWVDNSNNESGFLVERITAAYTDYQSVQVGAGTTSHSFAGLTPATTYLFRVSAYNASGNSSYSNEAQAMTPSAASANLALNKTATADNQQTANPASKGNDGNASTRWSASNYQANHWWKVDLGALYALAGTKVQFQYARNYKYKIEVSKDDVNWTTVVNQTTTTSTAQVREDNFGATGRFVRITYTGLPRYPKTMASHFEFQVFGGY